MFLRTQKLANRIFWPAVVVIILLGLVLRLTNLMFWPLWWDEGLHIMRAHRIAEGAFFTGIDRSKWLYMPVVAIFNPLGPEGPFVARYVTTLFGTATVGACIALGTYLDKRSTGLIAGLIYAIIPMAVFHERQAILDPMLSTLGMFTLLMSVSLTRKPRIWLTVLLGAVVAAAYLTKLSGITFLAVPVLAGFLFAPRKRWLRPIAYNLAALLIGLGIISFTQNQARIQGFYQREDYTVDFENTALNELAEEDRIEILVRDMGEYGNILVRYLLIGVPLLAAGSLLFAFRGKWAKPSEDEETILDALLPFAVRWEILFLIVPAFLFAAVPLLADKPSSRGRLAPRYLLPTAAPMVTLAAVTLAAALSWLRMRTDWRNPGYFVGLTVVLLAVPSMQFWVALQTDPTRVNLVPGDARVYLSGVNLNYSLRSASEDIITYWEETYRDTTGEVGVMTTGPEQFLASYTGPRVAEVVYITNREYEPAALPYWAVEGETILLVNDDQWVLTDSINDINHSMDLESTELGSTTLYEMTGASDRLAIKIHDLTVPDWERMGSEYESLGGALDASGRETPVYIFPPIHAEALPAVTDRQAEPLTVNHWPTTVEAAESALIESEALPATDGEIVDVVLVDEAASDPPRSILIALQSNFYRYRDSFYGLLHHVEYIAGPAEPDVESVDGVFEDAIQLDAIALVDPEPAAGSPMRVALEWSTRSVVEDSFLVFFHVVAADGTLLTQADGVPGGGLYPLPTWEPGEPVIDRFALDIPAEAAPGTYEIRVGIYEPNSGLRLRVTQGPGDAPDYLVVGSIEVR